MKRPFVRFAVLSFFSVLLVSCTGANLLDKKYAEDKPSFSLSKSGVSVDGASFFADQSLCDTLVLYSNRSWSTGTVTQDWISILDTAGINLGKTICEYPIRFIFADNATALQRSFTVNVTTQEGSIDIPVVQAPFTPVLNITSQKEYNQVAPEGGIFRADISSNTSWTATVSPESTANIVLGSDIGYKTDSLIIIVKPNSDLENEKKASVILSAAGVPDRTISFLQGKCVPMLEIDKDASDTEVLPAAGQNNLVFTTNVNWTAEIIRTTSSEILLSAESGTPATADDLTIFFPDATLERASATVLITTSTGLSDSITFVQNSGILLNFRGYPDNNGYGSRNHSALIKKGSTSEYIPRKDNDAGAVTWQGYDSRNLDYTIWSGSESAMFHSEACGLAVGSTTHNPAFYVEFPAIEGKKLVRVKAMLGNSDVKLKNQEATCTGRKAYIADSVGEVVEGGAVQEVRTYQIGREWTETTTIPSFQLDYKNHIESMFDFKLNGTEEGLAYRYYGEYRQVIRWFILYYE